jgi:hypothetical protein
MRGVGQKRQHPPGEDPAGVVLLADPREEERIDHIVIAGEEVGSDETFSPIQRGRSSCG